MKIQMRSLFSVAFWLISSASGLPHGPHAFIMQTRLVDQAGQGPSLPPSALQAVCRANVASLLSKVRSTEGSK